MAMAADSPGERVVVEGVDGAGGRVDPVHGARVLGYVRAKASVLLCYEGGG